MILSNGDGGRGVNQLGGRSHYLILYFCNSTCSSLDQIYIYIYIYIYMGSYHEKYSYSGDEYESRSENMINMLCSQL